jgi:hypothetical protein
MNKNWVVQYFVGGYLKTLYPETTKSKALFLMNFLIDGYCIKCIKGLFKGQILYKYNKRIHCENTLV